MAVIYTSRFTAPAAYVDTHGCAVVRMESEQNSSTLRLYLKICVSGSLAGRKMRLKALDVPSGHGTGAGRRLTGVHMGRPSKLTPHQRREAIASRDAGEALTDIARTFGVSHTTIGRLTAAPSA